MLNSIGTLKDVFQSMTLLEKLVEISLYGKFDERSSLVNLDVFYIAPPISN
jgi:hypothetical protein